MPLHFEWDPAKAHSNLAKHGLSFEEACSAFEDVLSITVPDPLHSDNEERLVLLGCTRRNRLVVVIHTEADETIRIIGARLATRQERESYEEG